MYYILLGQGIVSCLESSPKDIKIILFEIKATLSLLLVQQKTNSFYYQTRVKTAQAQAVQTYIKKKFFKRYLPYGLQQNIQLSILPFNRPGRTLCHR